MFHQATALVTRFLSGPLSFFSNIALFNPQGPVATQELNLMVTVIELMSVVVIAVFTFTFLIVWKYRVSNHVYKRYAPHAADSTRIELAWWGIPCIIVGILSIITWTSTHDLDPYKPLDSDVAPITIQVIALDWKWLFIYPDQGIATVNMVEFPANTPVNFEITADAPMNSFWIPELGGQIYAMPGMITQLHLEAYNAGSYRGESANLSGEGFAGMNFVARSATQFDFDEWVSQMKASATSSGALNQAAYDTLALPSEYNPVAFYSSADKNLFNGIVMKYMTSSNSGAAAIMPMSASSSMQGTSTQGEASNESTDMNMSGMDMTDK